LYADLPAAPALPKDKVDAYRLAGIKIIQVVRDNNFVLVIAINGPQFNDKDLQELLAIKDNIVQLKLEYGCYRSCFSTLSAMPILSRLHLENTKFPMLD
jgi:hypothetical protein